MLLYQTWYKKWMLINHLISKPPNQYYRPYLAIAHQVSYSSYPLVLKNLFLKRHTKKRNTTALHTVTGLQQSTKGTQKQYFSFRGPVNMAQKKNRKNWHVWLSCAWFALRNKTLAYFASLPSFNNANGRLGRERLLRSRNFATMVTWRHTSPLYWLNFERRHLAIQDVLLHIIA